MKSGRQIAILAAFIFLTVAVTARGQSFSLLSAAPTNSFTQTYNWTNTSPWIGDEQIKGYSNYLNYGFLGNSVTDAIIPLIQFEDVPLSVALENLAQAAGMNYIMDPWIGYEKNGIAGTVTLKWQKITAENAFSNLCKIYNIEAFKDPASGVTFIQAPNYRTKFLSVALFGRDTNVIPVIQFHDTPFTQALKEMAGNAKIDYVLDARIRFNVPDDNGKTLIEPRLSLHWHNLTATQAFIAICEQLGLDVTKYPESGVYRVQLPD